jgi:hypothetical protein
VQYSLSVLLITPFNPVVIMNLAVRVWNYVPFPGRNIFQIPYFKFFFSVVTLLIPLLQTRQPSSLVILVSSCRIEYGRIGFLIWRGWKFLFATGRRLAEISSLRSTRDSAEWLGQEANDSSQYSVVGSEWTALYFHPIKTIPGEVFNYVTGKLLLDFLVTPLYLLSWTCRGASWGANNH